VFVAGAVLAWRRCARAVALGLATVAVLPALTLLQQSNPWLLALLAAGLVMLVWLRWSRSEATVTR
jgi:type IV secretion system protein VirD4